MVAARGRVVRVFPLSTVILACQIGDSSVSLAECARLFRLGYLRRRFFLRTSSRPCVLRPSRVLGPTSNSSDTFRPTPLPNPPSFHPAETIPIFTTAICEESLYLKSKTFSGSFPFLMEPVTRSLRQVLFHRIDARKILHVGDEVDPPPSGKSFAESF